MSDTVTLPLNGPCATWPFDDTCCTLPDPIDSGEDEDPLLTRARAEATHILWAASGRRYGPCTVTVRPCLRRCLDGGTSGAFKGTDGLWRNAGCGCIEACSCTDLCEVVLPGPVASVESVQIDGLEVEDWRMVLVDGQPRLVREVGCWPSCQSMRAPCGDPGTFCVTYRRGLEVPTLGIVAVSELACELVKACIPGCECRLPRNIASKTRQGVTVVFDRSKPWWRVLPSVVAFLDLVNPHGLTRPARVFSPDVPRTRFEVPADGS